MGQGGRGARSRGVERSRTKEGGGCDRRRVADKKRARPRGRQRGRGEREPERTRNKEAKAKKVMPRVRSKNKRGFSEEKYPSVDQINRKTGLYPLYALRRKMTQPTKVSVV